MSSSPVKVLLVDNNATETLPLRESLSELSSSAFELIYAERLEQAVYLLNRDQVDIILLDLSLPDSEGLATLENIFLYGLDIPIVVLVEADDPTALEMVQKGAQDYLVKDQVTSQILKHNVLCAIERHKAHTQMRKFVREIQVDEARFHNLITRNADGIVVVDRNGIVRFVNPAAETLFEHSAEELLGEVFGFPVVAGETTEIDIVRRGEDVSGIAEMRVVETEWEGEAAYLTSLRDITEHKKALQALRTQEELNRSILNAIESHIAVVNEQGLVITINNSWADFAQQHPTIRTIEEATVGSNYFEACRQVLANHTHILDGINAVLQGQRTMFETEYCYQPDEVEERWFHLRAAPLGEYRQPGVVVSHTDITERKRAVKAEARAEAIAARVQEQEREIQALLLISNSSPSSITASMFGMHSLRESAPLVFEELVRSYATIMEQAMEQRAFKVKHDVSEGLRSMAERLGFLRAGPRDVVDIHSIMLQDKSRDANPIKAQAYIEEGRLMALELMGYLVSYYRNYSLGMSKNLLLDQQEERQSTVQEKE